MMKLTSFSGAGATTNVDLDHFFLFPVDFTFTLLKTCRFFLADVDYLINL